MLMVILMIQACILRPPDLGFGYLVLLHRVFLKAELLNLGSSWAPL